MEFFKEVFAWLKDVSAKLPSIDFEMYFIIVLAVIALVWVIIAFTLISSRSRKLMRACKKIRKYLAGVEAIDDDNVSDFTARCFGAKVPQPLRDAWMQYLGVRYGYPSEIVSDSAVYDKYVKKHKDIRSGIYLAVSLVLLALFAFWGYGFVESISMGVIHGAGLLLIAITYLLLIIFYRQQIKHALDSFENLQDDLDAKVNLQVESDYATDSSPLNELNSLVEEIVARNISKVVEVPESTPIEELIEQAEETVAEEPQEEVVEEPIQEVVEEPAEEIAEEVVEEVVEEPAEEIVEEPVEEVEEVVEEIAEEPIEEVEEEIVEEPVEVEEEVEEAQEEELEVVEEPSEEIEEPQEEAEEPIEEAVEEEIEEEEVSEESEPIEEQEPAVEEEAPVKPARLTKLPNLIDYMMTMNMSRSIKIQMASALISVYPKFKQNKEDRKVIIQCLSKILFDLQKSMQ